MRILSIHIRNLNSLTGDWSIRLDGPAYEGGIFAITGPTGAGKSTILDAVCLALYGSTPRLERITRSGNEIMSRHTADCAAEVSFRTPAGTFTCSWSQSRAGKKASGNLQQPRHRLYDEKGMCLAEKTTDVAEQVQRITGMDFGRFTQSMLLAQGKFASFLLADGDRRAPLLEQITGTEIYSDISKRVHLRNKNEAQKLDALDAELEGRNLLPEEAEQELVLRAAALKARGEELALKEAALQKEKERHKQAAALLREEKALEAEKDALQKAQLAFTPEKARLEGARRAGNLAGSLEALGIRREEQARDEGERTYLLREMPELEATSAGAQKNLAAARKALSEQREAWAGLRETCARVRAMDEDLAAGGRDMAALTLELETRQRALALREKERSDLDARRKHLEEALLRLEERKKRAAGDEALQQALGALCERLSHLRQREEERRSTLEALAGVRKKQALTAKALKEKEAAALLLEKEAALREEEQRAAAEALKTLLAGRDMGFHRARREALFTRLSRTDKALEDARRSLERRLKEEELAGREHELALTLARERQELESGRATLAALREALFLRARIRTYEEERQKLREGEPCPLCGSLHHPFVHALPPEDGEEGEAAALEKHLEALAASLAAHERDAVHAKSAREEIRAELRTLTARLGEALQAVFPLNGSFGTPEEEEALEKAVQKALLLTEKPSDLPPLLETLHKGTAEALAAASRLLEEAEKQESAMQRAREAGEALRHTCGEARAACLALEKEALGLAAEARGLENGLARLETLCREGLGELQKDMRPFGVEGEDTDMLEQGLRRLEARRDAFLALQKEEKSLRSAGDELSRAATACAEKLAGAAAACEESRNSLARRRQERQNLALARKQLFGLRDPEQEEKKATLLLRAEEAEETRLEREAERAKSACEQAGSALAVLAERLARRAETLFVMERELDSGLAAAGFADEKACRAALMAEKDLHVLEEKENALNRRALALETRGRELARRRDGLVSPALSPEDCARSMEETRREREEALRNLGGIGEILRANAIRKKEEGELRERRNAQALLCGKWKALDDLIGSADGKKFRNYAQELTFRALLGLANRQLAQMTDRYELTYSSTEALTLNVIDRYQADAVRSSRNLSGGESFIVSLALALALAQMAGRNVRVDSVFLDEGFGTLDEEALNTALDMLSALHEKGKVIGIISHVQAVRDRVPVQIAVEPAGNGRSRLSGPGVSGGNG